MTPRSMTGWAVGLALLTARVALAGGASAPGQGPATTRPNILLIFTDDHAFQSISAYGSTRNTTPQLDRLARGGVLFRHCLVPNSICGPSRATILTGKYSHLNGFARNGDKFDGSQDTVSKRLRAAGYQTAVIGKWHLGTDPTGFDHWEILPGQGDYYNPAMTADGTRVRHKDYTTDIITDLALRWMKSRDASRPFFLMCQHKAPHRPWEPNLSKLDLYEGATIPEPPTLFDTYEGRGLAAHEQDMTIAKTMNDLDLKLKTPPDLDAEQRKVWESAYGPRNEAFRKAKLTGKDLVRWKYQRYIKDYLRCVSSVDDNVGRLLDYLDASGLAANTLVVYASDQGFYLGEHGWFDKRWAYEESLHTPLIVRWPGVARAGVRNDDLVSTLDLAETFLDAAGRPIPPEMQGRSLAPLIRGETPADWRTSFYYRYYEYPAVHSVRTHEAVRTKRYKLIHFFEPEGWELFDLESDPRELTSRHDDPAYANVVRDLKAELGRLRAANRVPADDAAKPPPRP
jgi:arylsulfatase A-like enzyme